MQAFHQLRSIREPQKLGPRVFLKPKDRSGPLKVASSANFYQPTTTHCEPQLQSSHDQIRHALPLLTRSERLSGPQEDVRWRQETPLPIDPIVRPPKRLLRLRGRGQALSQAVPGRKSARLRSTLLG